MALPPYTPALSMASRTIKQIHRLSDYARSIHRKQTLLWQYRKLLHEVATNGGAVRGEQWLFGELDALLNDAQSDLETLNDARVLADSERILQQLDETLNDFIWEQAKLTVNRLIIQRDEQLNERAGVIEEIADWQRLVVTAEKELTLAQEVKAAVSREKQLLIKLKSIVSRANLALKDRDLRLLTESQRQWSEYQAEATALLTLIQGKHEASQATARLADMHIMQSPELNERYEYTILLRPPVELDTSSVNVQGDTTIVKQDRESIMEDVGDISEAINRGLARSFKAGQARTFVPDPVDEIVRNRPIFNANALIDQLGDLMYRLFMPDSMQGYFEEEENMCSLSITTNDLELPWELMKHENSFLCLERPIARTPMGRAMPSRATGNVTRHASNKLRFLLIYADPHKNLPLARKEIIQIERQLKFAWKDGIDIDTLGIDIPATGDALNHALLNENYDVIHYAGHAQFNEEDSDLSSLLMEDGEFFAQKLRRLMKGRPLVFLNACESGQAANATRAQETSYHHRARGMAEGLAAATIYGGAVGCIGPLWPVYDDAAAEFAIQFYNHVVEGHMIGKAMQLARQYVRHAYEQQITWASFVLYGNPTYKLVD